MIAHIVDYLMQLAGGLGYFGIIFIVGLEYACFPIPSEVVLPFVGMGIATGTYEMVYGFTASIIGAVFCHSVVAVPSFSRKNPESR